MPLRWQKASLDLSVALLVWIATFGFWFAWRVVENTREIAALARKDVERSAAALEVIRENNQLHRQMLDRLDREEE